jgi:GMP synthase (glutamine-hydrolysing)
VSRQGQWLLFLQNAPGRESPERLDERFADWGLDVDVRWAYGGDFPASLEGYAGIYLSGSPHGAYEPIPFIEREHDLIRDAAARRIPMLGMCFGSQILASALCGREHVFRRAQCEVGIKALAVDNAATDDPVCAGLGREVRMFVWHNDEVRADHSAMVVLATSDLCPNQIWRYRDAPVWGIQGHAELTRHSADAWFARHRARIEHDGAPLESLVTDELDDAKTSDMLERFARLVIER